MAVVEAVADAVAAEAAVEVGARVGHVAALFLLLMLHPVVRLLRAAAATACPLSNPALAHRQQVAAAMTAAAISVRSLALRPS